MENSSVYREKLNLSKTAFTVGKHYFCFVVILLTVKTKNYGRFKIQGERS